MRACSQSDSAISRVATHGRTAPATSRGKPERCRMPDTLLYSSAVSSWSRRRRSVNMISSRARAKAFRKLSGEKSSISSTSRREAPSAASRVGECSVMRSSVRCTVPNR